MNRSYQWFVGGALCTLMTAVTACGGKDKVAPADVSADASVDPTSDAPSASSDSLTTDVPAAPESAPATVVSALPPVPPPRRPSGDANPSARRIEARITQFGTSDEDVAWAVAASEQVVAVGGSTRGLLGSALVGGKDGFVRLEPSDGSPPAFDQFGTVEGDEVRAITLGAVAGEQVVWSTGQTDGLLVPADVADWSPASGDGFLRTMTIDSGETATRQFGTDKLEEVLCVERWQDQTFVAGGTIGSLGDKKFGDEDNFVMTFGGDGAIDRVVQHGTPKFEEILGMAVDARGIFLVGQTGGDLTKALPWAKVFGSDADGTVDLFVAHFDQDGKPSWVLQTGYPGWDAGQALVLTDDALYVVGRLEQAPVDGCTPVAGTVIGCDGLETPPKPAVAPEYDDGFVMRMDIGTDGIPTGTGWVDVFGDCQGDTAQGVALGESSTGQPELYVVGGHRGGEAHGGPIAAEDAVLRIYEPASGRLLEEWLLASDSYDRVLDVTQDPVTKDVVLVGQTQGTLPGQTSAGSCDAFVVRVTR